MSWETTGKSSLLRGSLSRSYGTLVQSIAHRNLIEYKYQPGETLQGLALKFGVTMEEIRRANRLYTNDSIFLKKSLYIPVMSHQDQQRLTNVFSPSLPDLEKKCDVEKTSDLTPADFLRRLDVLISRSKLAAAWGIKRAETRSADLRAACGGWAVAPQSVVTSPGVFTDPIPTTDTSQNAQDSEDEIFQL